MSYRAKEFDRLNEEFNDSATQILNENDKCISALENVLDCYNSLVVYAEIDYERKKKRTKEHIESTLGVNRITIQRCFEKLNLPVILPGKLLSTIHYAVQEPSGSGEEKSKPVLNILRQSLSYNKISSHKPSKCQTKPQNRKQSPIS